MIGHEGRLRPIETAPDWSHEVFEACAELTWLLETHTYRFARTMPEAPHSYTLKDTWEDGEVFVEALRKMRMVERVEEFFRGRWYRRFVANGYKYWTMGASLDHILVNRAIHALPLDPYAGLCDVYDLAVHETEADIARSKRVYGALEITPGTDILDIGCGTGCLVDFRFRDIPPEHYVGIDPSRGMLGSFRDKHPACHDRLIRTTFEDYWPKPGQQFDLVVGLFGVASHIGDPGLLSRKIRWLLKPGGTAVLMYNARPSHNMEFYRTLGIDTPAAAMVSDPFWTVRQDADWFTATAGKEHADGASV